MDMEMGPSLASAIRFLPRLASLPVLWRMQRNHNSSLNFHSGCKSTAKEMVALYFISEPALSTDGLLFLCYLWVYSLPVPSNTRRNQSKGQQPPHLFLSVSQLTLLAHRHRGIRWLPQNHLNSETSWSKDFYKKYFTRLT